MTTKFKIGDRVTLRYGTMGGVVVRTGIEGRSNGGVEMVRVDWTSGASSLVTVSDLTKVEA